jgi:sugar phosphate isomerase/epimerase
MPPPDAVTASVEAGCQFISLRIVQRGAQPAGTEIVPGGTVFKETKRRLRSEGLPVLDVEAWEVGPSFDRADSERNLAAAAELGARHVLTIVTDSDRNRRIENFAALCQAAAPYNLSIDVEFIPWNAVHNYIEARSLVDAAAQPNASILVDPLHLDRGKTTIAEIAAAPRHLFRFMQFCDGEKLVHPTEEELIFSARKERLFPDEGQIDLVGILRAMPPSIPLSLEIPREKLSKTVPAAERIRLAVDATRRVLARV